MTACAIEPTTEDGERDPEEGGRHTGDGEPDTGEDGDRTAAAPLVITADGAYAARLARSGDCWFPERWTLDGPEPYAVPLPGHQPEEPGTQVQPMADGQVLIHRRAAGRHTFTLLYPTGPGTGEHPLGAIGHQDGGAGAGTDPGGDAGLRLLPRPRAARAPTPSSSAGAPPPCGWWRAARSVRSASRRSPAAAPAGSGWTGRAGCWPWTGRPAAVPRRSWWTWGAAARSPHCCRSPPTATTGCCSPTPTAVCC